jgi:HEAT repeat protein
VRVLVAIALLAALAAARAAAEEPAPEPVAAAAAGAPAAAERTEQQIANLRKAILEGFADERPQARVAAADMLLAAWPDTAPILDEALAAKEAEVRLEAVRLLVRPELGDTRDRVRARFTDREASVRRQAIRVARRLAWTDVENDFTVLLESDASWLVRQEALRALEDRGTTKCLHVVLQGWIAERDTERRRRYRRVLVSILGVDCGDSADAWCTAVADARAR